MYIIRFSECLLFLGVMLGYAHPQSLPASTSVHAGGACSSAISGSGNHVTINCSDMPPPVAKQMLAVMNRILKQGLDFNQVNASLDNLTQQMTTINSTLAPLSDASPSDRLLVRKTDVLLQKCAAYLTDWSTKESELLPLGWLGTTQSDINANDPVVSEYKSQFEPRLLLFSKHLQATMPDIKMPQSWDVHDASGALYMSNTVRQLIAAYVREANERHITIDVGLAKEGFAIATDLEGKNLEWVHTNSSALQLRQSQILKKGQDERGAVSAEGSKRFNADLKPSLTEVRAAYQRRLSSSTFLADYDGVHSSSALAQVCTELQGARNGLVAEITAQQQDKRPVARH